MEQEQPLINFRNRSVPHLPRHRGGLLPKSGEKYSFSGVCFIQVFVARACTSPFFVAKYYYHYYHSYYYSEGLSSFIAHNIYEVLHEAKHILQGNAVLIRFLPRRSILSMDG